MLSTFFDRIELGVIVCNERVIVPFDLQHAAVHHGPRCGWDTMSDERLLALLRLVLLADSAVFHHRLYVSILYVWQEYILVHE